MPDLLKEHTGRVMLPRARWKELWITRPSSIAQMEQLLVKLVEQALWAATENTKEILPDSDKRNTGNVTFEPWMEMEAPSSIESGKDKKQKKKTKKKQHPHRKALDPMDAANSAAVRIQANWRGH